MERDIKEGSDIRGLHVIFEALKHLPSRREDGQSGGCHPSLWRKHWVQETMSQRCCQASLGNPQFMQLLPHKPFRQPQKLPGSSFPLKAVQSHSIACHYLSPLLLPSPNSTWPSGCIVLLRGPPDCTVVCQVSEQFWQGWGIQINLGYKCHGQIGKLLWEGSYSVTALCTLVGRRQLGQGIKGDSQGQLGRGVTCSILSCLCGQ